MKNFSTKKFLICTSVLFFLFWGFLIYAVPPIMIDPARFVATVRIQQVNLYYRVQSEHDTELSKDDIVKAWMTNHWWINRWVLYIRPVDASGDLVDETNNTILNPDHTSIIGWQMNTNRWDETSMILWGSKNTVDWHWVVLMWWDNNTALVDNATILWSANSTVWSSNGAVLAADGWNVQWKNSTIFWGGWNIYAWADNVFAIAWGANIAHQWIFSFGRTVSSKPNIAQFNIWQGIIVWWLKPNWNENIKLSVNWALAVWRGKCNREMIWAVYYKPWFSKCPARGGEPERMVPAYCLCSCVASWTAAKAVALSNQPYCDNLCACESDDATQCLLWPAKCWERWLAWTPKVYVSWQKWWPTPSKFCADNRSPIAYYIYSVDASGKKSETPKQSNECTYSSPDCEPPFPWMWEEVNWVCAWPAYCTQVECSAYREKEAPELAACWRNAKRYKAAEQNFTWDNESDFCKRLNPWAWASDRAHNGLLSAFTGLSKDQVQQLITTGFDISYISWELEDWFVLSHLEILNHLRNAFPMQWGRTYWKCQTSNAAYEVEWSEIVNEKECYAERLECNSCAADGFPYCFNVDFSDNCDCNDPVKCPVACIPWTDNAWNYYLHVSWDSTGTADTLKADSNTKVKSQSTELKAFIDGHRVIYEFPKNTSDEVKLYTASFSATGDVNYCDSWTTTIYQCPEWASWNDARQECMKNSCLWTLKPGAVLPEANKKNLEKSLEIFLTWADYADGVKCASRCARKDETYKDRNWKEHTANMDLTMLFRWNEPFCAKCEAGTAIPEAWWCEFKDPSDCLPPYKWFGDDETWKCALPWECVWVQTWAMVQKYEDIIPIAGKYWEATNWYCVSSEAEANAHPHQCVYSCNTSEWYICSNWVCSLPSCAWNTKNDWQWLLDNLKKWEEYYKALNPEYPNSATIKSMFEPYSFYYAPYTPDNWKNRYRALNKELQNDKTTADFYYDVYKSWSVYVENPVWVAEPWIFVEAGDRTEFDSKTDWLKWCFYWCTWGDYRYIDLWHGTAAYSCWVNPTVQESNPCYTGCDLPAYKDLCYWRISIGGDYSVTNFPSTVEENDSRFLTWEPKPWTFSDTPTNEACMYYCTPWTNKIKVDWKDFCWRKCWNDEYAVSNVCMKCAPWSQPSENDLDDFGNPRSCWKKCNSDEYVTSNGSCYSCWAWRKWNPKNLDSHWNSKSCVDICDEWETYYTIKPGETYCWVDKKGKAIENCCLSTYANSNNKKCVKNPDGTPKYPNCKIVWTNCVCYDEMQGV